MIQTESDVIGSVDLTKDPPNSNNNIENPNHINKSNAILAFILGAILIIIGAILCGIEFSNFNSIPVGIALIVMGAFSSVVCTILLTDENTDNETKTKEKVDDDE